MRLLVGKKRIDSYKNKPGEVQLPDIILYKKKANSDYLPAILIMEEGKDYTVEE